MFSFFKKYVLCLGMLVTFTFTMNQVCIASSNSEYNISLEEEKEEIKDLRIIFVYQALLNIYTVIICSMFEPPAIIRAYSGGERLNRDSNRVISSDVENNPEIISNNREEEMNTSNIDIMSTLNNNNQYNGEYGDIFGTGSDFSILK